jgi:ribonuclease HI
MSMTLFVDASFDAKTGCAGFGAWAKCDLWQSGLSFGGIIKTKCKTSAETEICGIANALARVAPTILENKISHVVLQCDNIRALGAIACNVRSGGVAKARNGVAIALVRDLTAVERKACDFIANLNIKIWVRHVRGHRSGDGRQGVNNMCDLLAKSYMRTQRAKLQTAEVAA